MVTIATQNGGPKQQETRRENAFDGHRHKSAFEDDLSYLKSLHEGLSTGLGDGTKVVDQIGLGHTDTGVDDGQGVTLAIRDDVNLQLLAGVQLAGVGQTFISDFVQGLSSKKNQECSRESIYFQDAPIVTVNVHSGLTSDEFDTNSRRKISLFE